MHGWFQKLFKSRISVLPQHEQEAKVHKNSMTSVSSISTSNSSVSPLRSMLSSSSSSPSPSPSSSSSSGTTPSKEQSALSSKLRWKRKYDVLVCHSTASSDIEEATRLVSFLEASPRSLRCFLLQRDTCPGGAIATEFCQAVQSSHLLALLITPNFLQDGWCNYMMHQALVDRPMSKRLIPLIQNLFHSQYPQELKFYYYTDLSKKPDQGYALIYKTVLNYLQDLVKNEVTLDCNSSSSGLDEGSSREDELMSQYDHAGTAILMEVMQKTNESFTDICCDHQQQNMMEEE